MTDMELRQKIEQQLSQLPSEQLSLVSDFLDTLQTETAADQTPLRRLTPLKRGTQAGDLLEFAGTWHGDDLEECLQYVYGTRSKAQF